MAELSRRIELVILHDSDGYEVVTERRSDGLVEAATHSSLEAARAWVEAHYEGVEWIKPRFGTALIGKLASGTTEGPQQ
jgi:hypothetical protein